MKNLYLLLGGAALMQLLRRPQIGKIVDGRPPGVTQCLDGKWSTYRPGRGVCSHHAGWRGLVKPVEDAEVIEEVTVPSPVEPPSPVAINEDDIRWGTRVRLMAAFEQLSKGTIGVHTRAPSQPFFGSKKVPGTLYVEFGFSPDAKMKAHHVPITMLEVIVEDDKTVIRRRTSEKPDLPPPPDGIYIEDIDYEAARRAFRGTSMRPEKRGRTQVLEHRNELVNLHRELAQGRTPDQLEYFNERWLNFVQRYTKLKYDYLRHHGSLMSTMVTGPARFPVRRQQKLRDQNDKKLKAFIDYWNKFVKSVKRDKGIYPENAPKEVIRSGADDAVERLRKEIDDRIALQEKYKLANKILRKTTKDEAFKEVGLSPAWVAKNLDPYTNKARIAPYLLTNNNQNINRLKKRLAAEEKTQVTRKDGPIAQTFPGGRVEENHVDNRLRIFFDDIPSAEDRRKLKKNGWRWSPKNVAWQRQLTDNAWRSATSLLSLNTQ